jgi:hypothetical protein
VSFCCRCGAQINPGSANCLKCGWSPKTISQTSNEGPQGATEVYADESPYRGVGGWLAWFIFSLVFLRPALQVRNFARSYAHNLSLFSQSKHPYSLYAFYFTEKAVLVAVVGYGVFAGIQLWRIQPRAVTHAKRCLVYLLLYILADYLLGLNWVALMTTEGHRLDAISNFFSGHALPTVLRTTLYVALWYSYLAKSQRVRATYGTND